MISDYEKELREINEKLDTLTIRKKEITDKIKAEHNKNYSEKYGGISVQYVPGFIALELDEDLLKKELPHIAVKYSKLVRKESTYRIVLVEGE